MSTIKITKNSKNIGPGCKYLLDIVRGCKNQCLGCYARAIYYQGSKTEFDQPKLLDFDKQKLSNQLKNFSKKEEPVVRIGVNSEPCVNIRLLKNVVNLCGKYNVKIIIITKSIIFSKPLVDVLKNSNVTLHISLGMISRAQSDEKRLAEAKRFEKEGIKVIYRIIDDVTQKPKDFFKKVIKENKYILVTPFRARSYNIARAYNLDLKNYTFHKSYFKPNFVNKEWRKKLNRFCGEIIKNNKAMRLCGRCFID